MLPTPSPGASAAKGFEDAAYPYPGHLDAIAHFWIAVASTYTLLVVAAMTVLFFHRKTYAMRMRNYWVTLASVGTLHVYLVIIMLLYPIRWWYGCTAEYWVMAIIFPVGIALYQATNARLVYCYETQMEILSQPSRAQRHKSPRPSSNLGRLLKNFKRFNFLDQTRVVIAIGMVFTLASSLFFFFGSKNFRQGHGFFGDWTGPINCFRGTKGEWVPTIVWQLFWCWIYGPYLYYRVRKIRDLHYWAFQTKATIIAGLPGSPLWIFFLYSNNGFVLSVNRWFPHAGWFIPFLVTIQWTSIICPLLDSWTTQSFLMGLKTVSGGAALSSRSASSCRLGRDLYMVSALDEALEKNAGPLLDWAAKRNFTAADINFLLYVRNWKKNWVGEDGEPRTLNGHQARERFEDAALIFFTFIDPKTSKATVNLDDPTHRKIAGFFAGLGYEGADDGDSFFSEHCQVAPWECDRSIKSLSQEIGSYEKSRLQRLDDKEDEVAYELVPAEFNLSVFDNAYRVIRDDIFYNTWIRYVDEMDTDSVRYDVERASSEQAYSVKDSSFSDGAKVSSEKAAAQQMPALPAKVHGAMS